MLEDMIMRRRRRQVYELDGLEVTEA